MRCHMVSCLSPRMQPGVTMFTRMLWGPSSRAISIEAVFMADLVDM